MTSLPADLGLSVSLPSSYARVYRGRVGVMDVKLRCAVFPALRAAHIAAPSRDSKSLSVRLYAEVAEQRFDLGADGTIALSPETRNELTPPLRIVSALSLDPADADAHAAQAAVIVEKAIRKVFAVREPSLPQAEARRLLEEGLSLLLRMEAAEVPRAVGLSLLGNELLVRREGAHSIAAPSFLKAVLREGFALTDAGTRLDGWDNGSAFPRRRTPNEWLACWNAQGQASAHQALEFAALSERLLADPRLRAALPALRKRFPEETARLESLMPADAGPLFAVAA